MIALDQRQDFIVRSVLGALEPLNVAIDDIAAGDLIAIERHDLVLHHVLDLFDRDGVAALFAGLSDVLRGIDHLAIGQALAVANLRVRRLDGTDDFLDIERYLGAAALDDLHERRSLFRKPREAKHLAGKSLPCQDSATPQARPGPYQTWLRVYRFLTTISRRPDTVFRARAWRFLFSCLSMIHHLNALYPD